KRWRTSNASARLTRRDHGTFEPSLYVKTNPSPPSAAEMIRCGLSKTAALIPRYRSAIDVAAWSPAAGYSDPAIARTSSAIGCDATDCGTPPKWRQMSAHGRATAPIRVMPRSAVSPVRTISTAYHIHRPRVRRTPGISCEARLNEDGAP